MIRHLRMSRWCGAAACRKTGFGSASPLQSASSIAGRVSKAMLRDRSLPWFGGLRTTTGPLAPHSRSPKPPVSATLARNLLGTLRKQELDSAGEALAARHGRLANAVAEGEHVSGTYRKHITLASGRFAMIDDGVGFQLVPWRRDLERYLGKEIAGKVNARGGVDWNFARSRGPVI